jgi:hypothetical protein
VIPTVLAASEQMSRPVRVVLPPASANCSAVFVVFVVVSYSYTRDAFCRCPPDAHVTASCIVQEQLQPYLLNSHDDRSLFRSP